MKPTLERTFAGLAALLISTACQCDRQPQIIRWFCCGAWSLEKSETQLIAGEFYPKAYPKAAQGEGRFNAPNAYKVIATLDLDGDGKMEIVAGYRAVRR